MKTIFVRDLPAHANQDVTSFFLVRFRELKVRKSGEAYLALVLGDRTGEVEARLWDNLESAPAFERDDVVKVLGLVQLFRGQHQIVVKKVRVARPEEVHLDDYLPRSERDPEDMFAELAGIVAGMGNEHIRGLVQSVLADEEIAARFKRAPAAKSLHHAYLGGLLEHVLSLCGLARAAAAHYPSLDLDLLLAACVLHDLGKIRELDYTRGFSYTTEGHLLGHIVIGLEMVAAKARLLPGFPEPLLSLLRHMIASHHGEYEYGSPRLPQFPEALVFHYLDDLDSKMNSMAAQIEGAVANGEWTPRNPSLGRALLRRDAYYPQAGPIGPAAGESGTPETVAENTGPSSGPVVEHSTAGCEKTPTPPAETQSVDTPAASAPLEGMGGGS